MALPFLLSLGLPALAGTGLLGGLTTAAPFLANPAILAGIGSGLGTAIQTGDLQQGLKAGAEKPVPPAPTDTTGDVGLDSVSQTGSFSVGAHESYASHADPPAAWYVSKSAPIVSASSSEIASFVSSVASSSDPVSSPVAEDSSSRRRRGRIGIVSLPPVDTGRQRTAEASLRQRSRGTEIFRPCLSS